MWLILAFVSASLLGLYDVFKKSCLKDNAVIPILTINTILCSLIFLPFALISWNTDILDDSIFHVEQSGLREQGYIIIKSIIVLSSWICGYFGMKNLPLTIVGPINATRPVMTLVGAMLIFGERLNIWQMTGVALAVVSFLLLSRSGKKEGIHFKHDKNIYLIVAAAVLGALSGCYDKFLMAPVENGGVGLDRMLVQSCYNFYQVLMMSIILLVLWYPKRKATTPFRWDWRIIAVSVFLSIADFAYFYALSLPGAMISIVSMVRRSSVLVSFMFGALMFREKNLKAKFIDLLLVLIGMLFIYFGTR